MPFDPKAFLLDAEANPAHLTRVVSQAMTGRVFTHMIHRICLLT